MSTLLRTVTDLTELNRLGENDFIEVSHTDDDNKYSSRKYRYSSLQSQIQNISLDAVSNRWNIEDIDDLSKTVENVDNIKKCLETKNGQIVFAEQPILDESAQTSTNKNALQTKQQVENTVLSKSAYVTSNSFIECNPENDSGYTKEYQYFWKIENGEYDSSLAYDENGFQIGGITITRTGYLTIYGWLASNADVQPQNAWVGLYGRIADKWILLQLQPWVMGRNAQLMQYVGFGLQVKAGLQLKIMTGFPVNGNQSGFHSYSHTLLLSDKGNVVNSFVGYVVEN